MKPRFNKVNENIDWAKWSWNPVVGCKHGCPYCYAQTIHTRFSTVPFSVPTFYEERLEAPLNTRIPKKVTGDGWNKVFVCSMADLFGEWVPQIWIDAVMKVVKENPQWTFIFLTKNPERLLTIAWPNNAWVGTTVDTLARVKRAEDVMGLLNVKVRFVSVEPMLEPVLFTKPYLFDWFIIGAQSQTTPYPKLKPHRREFQPPANWINDLVNQVRGAGKKVYIKPNVKNIQNGPKEYPS